MNRWSRGGPSETPDSNGSVLVRLRCEGRVAKRNDMPIIEAGMAKASNP